MSDEGGADSPAGEEQEPRKLTLRVMTGET